MITITIQASESWDEGSERFVNTEEQTLVLEHSLASISKWESEWHKPFLTKQAKTFEETIHYVKCMTLTDDVNPDVYRNITIANVDLINKYIDNPMTATVISENKTGGGNREVTTSELIYYWMVMLNIPFECQYWHLNRLITLIQVCNIKNSPSKKMSKREIMSQNTALNAARRKQYNSKG